MKFGRLFIGKRKCSDEGNFVIASWSYVTGYWRWAIWYRKPKAIHQTFKWPLISPSYNSGKLYFASKGRFGANVVIPLIGYLHIGTQPSFPEMKHRH